MSQNAAHDISEKDVVVPVKPAVSDLLVGYQKRYEEILVIIRELNAKKDALVEEGLRIEGSIKTLKSLL